MSKAAIVTAIIAIYDAVLSTYDAVRDHLLNRVKVKVSVRRDMAVMGDPRYEGLALATIDAVNFGRTNCVRPSVEALEVGNRATIRLQKNAC